MRKISTISIIGIVLFTSLVYSLPSGKKFEPKGDFKKLIYPEPGKNYSDSEYRKILLNNAAVSLRLNEESAKYIYEIYDPGFIFGEVIHIPKQSGPFVSFTDANINANMAFTKTDCEILKVKFKDDGSKRYNLNLNDWWLWGRGNHIDTGEREYEEEVFSDNDSTKSYTERRNPIAFKWYGNFYDPYLSVPTEYGSVPKFGGMPYITEKDKQEGRSKKIVFPKWARLQHFAFLSQDNFRWLTKTPPPKGMYGVNTLHEFALRTAPGCIVEYFWTPDLWDGDEVQALLKSRFDPIDTKTGKRIEASNRLNWAISPTVVEFLAGPSLERYNIRGDGFTGDGFTLIQKGGYSCSDEYMIPADYSVLRAWEFPARFRIWNGTKVDDTIPYLGMIDDDLMYDFSKEDPFTKILNTNKDGIFLYVYDDEETRKHLWYAHDRYLYGYETNTIESRLDKFTGKYPFICYPPINPDVNSEEARIMRITYFTKSYYAKLRLAKFVIPGPEWNEETGDFEEVDNKFVKEYDNYFDDEKHLGDINKRDDLYLGIEKSPYASPYRTYMEQFNPNVRSPIYDYMSDIDMLWEKNAGKLVLKPTMITAAIACGALYKNGDERYASSTSLKNIFPFFDSKDKLGLVYPMRGNHFYNTLISYASPSDNQVRPINDNGFQVPGWHYKLCRGKHSFYTEAVGSRKDGIWLISKGYNDHFGGSGDTARISSSTSAPNSGILYGGSVDRLVIVNKAKAMNIPLKEGYKRFILNGPYMTVSSRTYNRLGHKYFENLAGHSLVKADVTGAYIDSFCKVKAVLDKGYIDQIKDMDYFYIKKSKDQILGSRTMKPASSIAINRIPVSVYKRDNLITDEMGKIDSNKKVIPLFFAYQPRMWLNHKKVEATVHYNFNQEYLSNHKESPKIRVRSPNNDEYVMYQKESKKPEVVEWYKKNSKIEIDILREPEMVDKSAFGLRSSYVASNNKSMLLQDKEIRKRICELTGWKDSEIDGIVERIYKYAEKDGVYSPQVADRVDYAHNIIVDKVKPVNREQWYGKHIFGYRYIQNASMTYEYTNEINSYSNMAMTDMFGPRIFRDMLEIGGYIQYPFSQYAADNEPRVSSMAYKCKTENEFFEKLICRQAEPGMNADLFKLYTYSHEGLGFMKLMFTLFPGGEYSSYANDGVLMYSYNRNAINGTPVSDDIQNLTSYYLSNGTSVYSEKGKDIVYLNCEGRIPVKGLRSLAGGNLRKALYEKLEGCRDAVYTLFGIDNPIVLESNVEFGKDKVLNDGIYLGNNKVDKEPDIGSRAFTQRALSATDANILALLFPNYFKGLDVTSYYDMIYNYRNIYTGIEDDKPAIRQYYDKLRYGTIHSVGPFPTPSHYKGTYQSLENGVEYEHMSRWFERMYNFERSPENIDNNLQHFYDNFGKLELAKCYFGGNPVKFYEFIYIDGLPTTYMKRLKEEAAKEIDSIWAPMYENMVNNQTIALVNYSPVCPPEMKDYTVYCLNPTINKLFEECN